MEGEGEFSTADHLLDLREERRDGQKIRDDANNVNLRLIVYNLEATDCRIILSAKNTGSWITVWGTTVNYTVLV